MENRTISESKVYSREEVAEILQVSVFTVDNRLKEGRLKKVKGMHQVRISGKELLRFINSK